MSGVGTTYQRLEAGIRFRLVLFWLTCLTATPLCAQTINTQPRYYYAIEDLRTGDVIRRGTSGTNGIPQNGIILAPDSKYREWLFHADTGLIGYQDFTTPGAGGRFVIPPVRLGLAFTPDSDGDGLSDDAEFVLGTDQSNPDTDGDGFSDGAALRLGLDPGLLSRTGVIGSAQTDGDAVDVCAVNDIAIVADSAAGVTVFNVFNRMAPIRIAQVDTPGSATAVTCSGSLVAVADGPAGLVIIDITDPPAARIVRQTTTFYLGGGNARCVTAIGDIALVGTDSGWLSRVEMETGVVLEQLNLGGAIEDVTSEGDTLYVFAAGQLQVIPLLQQEAFRVIGNAPASGSFPAPRGRIFAGGGVVYLTFANGYMAFDVSNRTSPRLVQDSRGAFVGWRQMVPDGSRYALVPGGLATAGLNRYLMTNSTALAVYETTIEAPGVPGSVALYNGLAYMASGANGLHVINYREVDKGRQPPTGRLLVSVTNGTVAEGQRIVLHADVRDDVQLRNVEFFANGQRLLMDGNFPYEIGWRAPARTIMTNVTFTALAMDTGGNQTNLVSIALAIVPDTNAPTAAIRSPAANQTFTSGELIYLDLGLSDNVGIDPDSIEFLLDGAPVQAFRISVSNWAIEAPRRRGTYQVSVRARDFSGQQSNTATLRFFVTEDGISREFTVFSYDPLEVGHRDSVSREFTVFTYDPADVGFHDAVSREFTVFTYDPADVGFHDAVSREFTVFTYSAEDSRHGGDAISREFSVFNMDSPEIKDANSREFTVERK